MPRRISASTPVMVVWTVLVVLVMVMMVMPARRVGADETPGLSQARARADAVTKQISDLQSELAGLDDEVTQLEADRADAQAKLDQLAEQVREVAVRRYTDVGQEQIFIPGADVNAQERAEALASIVTQSDTDSIDEYRATKDRLEKTSTALADRQSDKHSRLTEMQRRQDELYSELSKLEALEAQRVAAERKAAEEAARQAADARARDEAAKQAQQLKGREDATQAGKAGGAGTQAGASSPGPASTTPAAPPPPIASGAFVCPVQGPVSFVDSYGAPRASGNAHRGVDMMSPRGTPVVIPVSGNVVTRSGGIGGLQFHLNGDDGNFYYGAHMDSFSGAQGHLPAGTVVGYVGDTGDARGTGTHLHFEIHIGGYGHPIDPYPTVSRYC